MLNAASPVSRGSASSSLQASRSPNSPVRLVRFLTRLLPTAAALGSTIPVYGPLFGFRAASLLIAFLALTFPPKPSGGFFGQSFAILTCVWIGMGSALSVFALDRTAALRTMTSVLIGLLLAVAVLRIMASEPRFLIWMVQGWLISFALMSSIGTWEITTGQHLESYFLSDSNVASTLPAATFSNPNAFAIYLVGIQAILLWSISRASAMRSRAFFVSCSALCGFLIMTTGSRLSLGGFFLLIAAYLAFDRRKAWRPVLVLFLCGYFVWQAAPNLVTTLAELTPIDVRHSSLSTILPEFDEEGTSGGQRIELFKTAGWLTATSGGLGVGPGNFGVAIQELRPPYEVGTLRSPHNFVGELTSEFGLPVLVAFCVFAWSIVRRVYGRTGTERAVVLATGVAFIPAGIANSQYLLSSTMWTLFATILCFVVFEEAADS